jgi:hypothetical protein
MKQQQIKKQDAADATRSALDNLHEVRTLGEIADLVRYGDDSGDEIAQNQLHVLQNVIDEKLHDVFHAVDYANDYFRQRPKKRAKNKLAVVKKVA